MTIDDVRHISVVGAGTMGAQIAQQCALHGYDVTLTDGRPEALPKALSSNRAFLERRVAKGTLGADEMEAALARVRGVETLAEAVCDADVVIEAVYEQLEPKRVVFAQLDALCPPRTILVSNSSTIIISRIVEGIGRRDRCANMHFFHPALLLPLVEVVRGPETSDETVELVVELTRRIGKQPVVMTREISGFIVNRILGALMKEALWLADEGYATPAEIDRAVKLGLNHPMGPFELADFSGLDISYQVRMLQYQETGDPSDKPPHILEDLVEQGHLGRKTGKGFYEYPKSAFRGS